MCTFVSRGDGVAFLHVTSPVDRYRLMSFWYSFLLITKGNDEEKPEMTSEVKRRHFLIQHKRWRTVSCLRTNRIKPDRSDVVLLCHVTLRNHGYPFICQLAVTSASMSRRSYVLNSLMSQEPEGDSRFGFIWSSMRNILSKFVSTECPRILNNNKKNLLPLTIFLPCLAPVLLFNINTLKLI